jgi:hypothetical protein
MSVNGEETNVPSTGEELNNRLEAELETSRTARATSRFLKVLTFQIVKRALTEHFGENYSYCCLQSSVAIKQVLENFGIKSSLIMGGVCLPVVSKGVKFKSGWHGFWGEHHHFWVITEFDEIVDLTIAQINLHPKSPGPDYVDPYPVWTNDARFYSNVFMYMPKGPGPEGLVDRQFLCTVQNYTEAYIANPSRDLDAEMTIVEGIQTCQALLPRDEWARKTRQALEDPLPSWVEEEVRRLRSLMRTE